MNNRTELQNEIVEYAQRHPESTSREISEFIGCSPSYANEVRREYLDAIVGENDLSGLSRTPILSRPHEIFVTDECLTKLGIADGDVVELTIENSNENTTIRAPVHDISKVDKQKEMHSYVYGLRGLVPELPNNLNDGLSQFINNESEQDLSIYTSEAFEDYVNVVQEIIDSKIQNNDIFVGLGYLQSDLGLVRRNLLP